MYSQTRSQAKLLKALSGMTSKETVHLDDTFKKSGCEDTENEKDDVTNLLIQNGLDTKIDIMNLL